MNNFIKQVIEEKFASKAQQRFFYAKANEEGAPKKEKKKWGKWAKEFSDKTNYDKIPDKVEEEEIEEIVDAQGNIQMSKKPANAATKGITQKKTSDEVVKSAGSQMGNYGTIGVQNYRKYWGEGKELTKGKLMEIALGDTLGADETILKDKSYKEAYTYFTKELGLPREKALEKMADLGYSEELPGDQVIMVENPKKYIEEYIDELLKKRNQNDDLVSKDEEIEEIEINPIVKRQIQSLKNSMKTYGLKPNQVLKNLEDNE
jgi:hypothetical protein